MEPEDYDGFTTSCSSDTSDSGIGSATTTPYRTPTGYSKTASESTEAIGRKRRILFAGIVARMGEEGQLQRVIFGGVVGGKGYTGRHKKDWIDYLKEDMSVFGKKLKGW